jgi:LCP family protein required for cell wall assembly
MRTTLKRGIGRVGGLNGNGHSALPPLLGPVTRYSQPEPPRRSLAGLVLRGFGWFVLAVVVLVSGVAGGLYLYTHETLTALKAPVNSPTGRAQVVLNTIASPREPAVALIAGYDHRAGTGTNSYAGSNSDTLMLVRADPTNHTLSLLSLPRDLYVPIYCRGNTVTTQDRINSAWAICGNDGPSATVLTMEHLLPGVKINYLITLDFHAFKQLVNRLHGVYMNVDRRYYNPRGTGWAAINLQPGYQKLDGGEALSYVRFRHYDSDIYRTGRQQLFLDALKNRLRTSLSISSLPLELPKLISALKGNLAYAKAGGGTVTIGEILSYLGIAYHLPPGHLFRNSIPLKDIQYVTTPGGADVVEASPSVIDQTVHDFLHPNLQQPQQVNLQAGGSKPHRPKAKQQQQLPKSKISVLVLNAGSVPGLAKNTSYLLAKQGYQTAQLPASVTANAPALARDTIVYYDPVQPTAKQAARQLLPLFGAHSRVEQMTTAIAGYAQQAGNPLTVVAVGTRFGGKLVIPQAVKPAKPVPPLVSPGTSIVVPPVQGIAHDVHFPVLVPHQVAQSAQLSQEEGVRLFRPLRGHQELVLTFVQPDGIQYWQVEETDWTSPPILANPTGHILYHHRTFDLYTTGGAIQMVALRTPKAVYWVVNTILNELSNSTMIAIAESLQPLAR